MKIKKLKIQNYKNLNIDFGHNSDIITIIGNNGSGKSNLLESISLIFRSLYVSRNDVQFNYFIEYLTSAGKKVEIQKTGPTLALRLDGKLILDITPYLPKNIIAIYSGEESRLFDKCYGPFYLEFVRGINSAQAQGTTLYSSLPKMLFLNKFYWDLSLLCFLLSDLPDNIKFVTDILKITKVDKVTFKFNKANYVKYNDNQALELVKYIDTKVEYNIIELKEKLNSRYDIVDVFKYLYLAFTPKDAKIISEINITFNNGLTVSDLSEGEKKLLLIKAAMEFASNEDSLYILDEPDAHIHINNKEQIINSIEDYKTNRQIIITTHSPTLTQCLENDNIYMLSNGKVEDKTKQEIISEITGEFWNKQEQNVFLSLAKDTILVEGKTDKMHLEVALRKLQSVDAKYALLDFKYLPFNGASGLKLFVDEFPVSAESLTIAFVDRDQAGADAIKETLLFTGTIDAFTGNVKNHIHIYYIPKKDGFLKTNFVIEDYYPFEVYKDFLLKDIDCVTELPNNTKSGFKDRFAKSVNDLTPDKFDGFRKLFDLILTVKGISTT